MIHIIAAATAGAAFNIGGIAAVLYLVRTRAEATGRVRGYRNMGRRPIDTVILFQQIVKEEG